MRRIWFWGTEGHRNRGGTLNSLGAGFGGIVDLRRDAGATVHLPSQMFAVIEQESDAMVAGVRRTRECQGRILDLA